MVQGRQVERRHQSQRYPERRIDEVRPAAEVSEANDGKKQEARRAGDTEDEELASSTSMICCEGKRTCETRGAVGEGRGDRHVMSIRIDWSTLEERPSLASLVHRPFPPSASPLSLSLTLAPSSHPLPTSTIPLDRIRGQGKEVARIVIDRDEVAQDAQRSMRERRVGREVEGDL